MAVEDLKICKDGDRMTNIYRGVRGKKNETKDWMKTGNFKRLDKKRERRKNKNGIIISKEVLWSGSKT